MLHNYLMISLVVMLLALVYSESNVESEATVSEPKAIECYQGTNILAENIHDADDCPLLEGIKMVTCQTNVTSCYAYLNSQLKVQFGCDTQNYCDPNSELKKVKAFVVLCCKSDLCNCDIKESRKKREL